MDWIHLWIGLDLVG